jgi:purine-binding chemotaxis protein CheW
MNRQRTGSTALAAAPSALTASAEHAQYLTFVLDKEVFAIGILSIKEILEYRDLTSVPMMPEWIRGVINLRGAVVPVMDLSARFGWKPSVVTKRTCVVIVEIEARGRRQTAGVMVDAVNQVLEIRASEIEPAPVFGSKIRSDFVQGMGKVDGKFVVVLDVDHVLSLDEASALEDIGRLVEGTPIEQ